MWTNSSEEEKTKYKKIVLKNIKELVNSVEIYNFPDISAYFLTWLSQNPKSKTFEDFVMYVIFETQWYLSGYREDGGVWAELLLPDAQNIREFAEDWVAEEDRKCFLKNSSNPSMSRETDP